MNKYQEDYVEFIKSLKYIDELVDSLTIEQRKSLGATTWSIQGVLGRYINEEKDFIKELVDRETPMKPLAQYNTHGTIKWWNCDKCKSPNMLFKGDRCINDDCGQRQDWSVMKNEQV